MKSELAAYEILGVSANASPEEVSAAYRILAQIFHPDRFSHSPESVRREAEQRMKALNEAYAAARKGELGVIPTGRGATNGHTGRRSPGFAWPQHMPGPGSQKFKGVPWDEAVKGRAEQAAAAEEARRSREQAARNGNAVARLKRPQHEVASTLAGLGMARFTNNIVCRGCHSVQWLPQDWRQRLGDTQFYCCFCDRLIFSR